jgi:hypothetical protein
MGNQFSPWSDMELTQLKELAGQFSAVHISAQIGRSTEGVRKMTKKLGLKSFVSTPPKPRPAARRTPVERQDTPKPVLSPIKPTVLRKANVTHVSYPPLEWCETCHAPVSNWADHRARMGCRRTA